MNAVAASHAAEGSATWPAWPTYALQQDLLPVLSAWTAGGHAVAMATLLEIRGHSPRPLGSEMAIRDDGEVAGYVSGGCVEAAVAHEALAALAEGRPRWLSYGEGSDVLDIQLGCGGGIGVLVRPLQAPEALLAHWRIARHARRTLTLALDRRLGTHRFIDDAEADILGPDEVLQRHLPPPRLVLVGGDPCTLATIELAARMGIEVLLLRPHGPEHPPAGLASSHYDRRSLPLALDDLALDTRTALYSLSHDMAIDLAVARHALASHAACVGVLGSRSKRALLVDALQDAGVTPEQLARLRMPAGMHLSPSTPYSIALGIICEALQWIAAGAVPQRDVQAFAR